MGWKDLDLIQPLPQTGVISDTLLIFDRSFSNLLPKVSGEGQYIISPNNQVQCSTTLAVNFFPMCLTQDFAAVEAYS